MTKPYDLIVIVIVIGTGCRFPFKVSLLIFQLALLTLSMCHCAQVPASHTHRFSVRRRLHRDFRASHVGPQVVTA